MPTAMPRKVKLKERKMTSATQTNLLKRLEKKTLIGRIRPLTTKNKKNLCRICLIDRKTIQIFQNETLLMETIKSPKRGDDIIVPDISQDDDRNENLSPRCGIYNLRPNPNPNYSEDFRY